MAQRGQDPRHYLPTGHRGVLLYNTTNPLSLYNTTNRLSLYNTTNRLSLYNTTNPPSGALILLLLKFHNLLNTINPNIQFTIEYSNTCTSIPFLDVKVIKSGTEILTDIFYKTTDTHQYFNFKAKKNFTIIERISELQKIIPKSDLLHSQRQPPNLKELLKQAKCNSTPEKFSFYMRRLPVLYMPISQHRFLYYFQMWKIFFCK
jgi:hypothetical protein